MYAVIFLFCSLSFTLIYNDSLNNEIPKLIWISIDGFHPDYITRETTPFLYMLKEKSSASYMNPTFFTKTFPNHITQVTGLYQEQHGIVANKMYDSDTKQYFYLSNTDIIWWDPYNNITPIWIENQKNTTRNTAVIDWPGSNVKFQNSYPHYYHKQYKKNSAFKRLDEAIYLIDSNIFNFIMIYINEIDKIGHSYGPNSDQLQFELSKIDLAINEFFNKVQNISKSYNLLITSDHGMADMNNAKIYFIDDYLNNMSLISVSSYGPSAMVYLTEKSEEIIQLIYKNLSVEADFKVYHKNNIPEHFHYKFNSHISDFIILLKPGCCILPNHNYTRKDCQKGDHGYIPMEHSMRAIFIISGPGIKSNQTVNPLNSHEIYYIVCRLLKLHNCHGSERWNLYDNLFI